MARISPLLDHHDAVGAILLPYGPSESGVRLVESFAPFGLEYAALRTAAALFDAPSRGLVRVCGSERIAFLQRMITGDLRGLLSWHSRRAFWLNRKGRIDADILAIDLPAGGSPAIAAEPCVLLELDIHVARHTLDTLSAFVIADDVTIDNLSDSTHQFQLHGPAALALLAAHSSPAAGPLLIELSDGQCCSIRIATPTGPIEALVVRQDLTADIGLSIITSIAHAPAIYAAISDLPAPPTQEGGALAPKTTPQDRLARRIGWHAFNVARMEAGTALFNLDFGPTSLPHETGTETLASRVSFTKGCYLGQEVVARMHALGHAKQRLVALDFPTVSTRPTDQPVTGSLVFATADTGQAPVGAVTSSAISPMLGGKTIAFAMVKYVSSTPGCTLYVQPSPEAALVPVTVRESLRFWNRPGIDPASR